MKSPSNTNFQTPYFFNTLLVCFQLCCGASSQNIYQDDSTHHTSLHGCSSCGAGPQPTPSPATPCTFVALAAGLRTHFGSTLGFGILVAPKCSSTARWPDPDAFCWAAKRAPCRDCHQGHAPWFMGFTKQPLHGGKLAGVIFDLFVVRFG